MKHQIGSFFEASHCLSALVRHNSTEVRSIFMILSAVVVADNDRLDFVHIDGSTESRGTGCLPYLRTTNLVVSKWKTSHTKPAPGWFRALLGPRLKRR